MPMSPDEINQINRQLRYISCQGVIHKAAQIYTADLDPSMDYSAFLIVGSDECLCLPNESTASTKQTIQWKKHNWLQWATSASDLTFKGCIRWLLSEPQDEGDGPSLEEVFEVLDGRRSFF